MFTKISASFLHFFKCSLFILVMGIFQYFLTGHLAEAFVSLYMIKVRGSELSF